MTHCVGIAFTTLRYVNNSVQFLVKYRFVSVS